MKRIIFSGGNASIYCLFFSIRAKLRQGNNDLVGRSGHSLPYVLLFFRLHLIREFDLARNLLFGHSSRKYLSRNQAAVTRREGAHNFFLLLESPKLQPIMHFKTFAPPSLEDSKLSNANKPGLLSTMQLTTTIRIQ